MADTNLDAAWFQIIENRTNRKLVFQTLLSIFKVWCLIIWHPLASIGEEEWWRNQQDYFTSGNQESARWNILY